MNLCYTAYKRRHFHPRTFLALAYTHHHFASAVSTPMIFGIPPGALFSSFEFVFKTQDNSTLDVESVKGAWKNYRAHDDGFMNK
jgi:hypothetical protein